jgi:hypothetical protein
MICNTNIFECSRMFLHAFHVVLTFFQLAFDYSRRPIIKQNVLHDTRKQNEPSLKTEEQLIYLKNLNAASMYNFWTYL